MSNSLTRPSILNLKDPCASKPWRSGDYTVARLRLMFANTFKRPWQWKPNTPSLEACRKNKGNSYVARTRYLIQWILCSDAYEWFPVWTSQFVRVLSGNIRTNLSWTGYLQREGQITKVDSWWVSGYTEPPLLNWLAVAAKGAKLKCLSRG